MSEETPADAGTGEPAPAVEPSPTGARRGRHARTDRDPPEAVGTATSEPSPPTPDVATDGHGRHVRGDAGADLAPSADNGSDGGSGRGTGRKGTGPPRRSARRWIVEWVVIILVALVVAFAVRTYVAQTFYVPSTSMYPTLKAGDRIVVDKLAFHLHGVDRGDIIVFKTPPAEDGRCAGPPVPDLVKRVVGLPGETISDRNGHVYITGKLLKEPWLPKVKSTYTAPFTPVHIPANQYFVMGDNRVDSCDSRIWGTVKRSAIVGKVDFIIWPFSQLRFF